MDREGHEFYSCPSNIIWGMRFSAWRFEGFVDNVTDTHTITNYAWSIDPCGKGATAACESQISRLQQQWTFRPRTFGMTAIYRY